MRFRTLRQPKPLPTMLQSAPRSNAAHWSHTARQSAPGATLIVIASVASLTLACSRSRARARPGDRSADAGVTAAFSDATDVDAASADAGLIAVAPPPYHDVEALVMRDCPKPAAYDRARVHAGEPLSLGSLRECQAATGSPGVHRLVAVDLVSWSDSANQYVQYAGSGAGRPLVDTLIVAFQSNGPRIPAECGQLGDVAAPYVLALLGWHDANDARLAATLQGQIEQPVTGFAARIHLGDMPVLIFGSKGVQHGKAYCNTGFISGAVADEDRAAVVDVPLREPRR